MRNVPIYLLLAAMTLAVYWPARRFSFVNYDDDPYVYGNRHVIAGLTPANARWALETFDVANYHPLTWLSYLLDSSLFGISAEPFHLENILLHTLDTVLLFGVLSSATHQRWPAAFVAGVFALHPLHVESVAWVSERKDLLSTLFLLVALGMYLRYIRGKRKWIWYLLMIGCYVAGLLAKPMIVTFPLLLILLDYWPLRRSLGWVRQFSEKSPLLFLSLASCIVTFLAQQQAGVVQGLQHLPLNIRFENVFVSYVRYLGKSFWPIDLAVFYPYRIDWSIFAVVASAALIIVLTILFIGQSKKRPYLPVGWFWFLGTLVPVIGVVQAGAQSMADRYMYLPLIGLAIMLAWTGAELAKVSFSAVVAAAVFVLIAASFSTHHQLQYWQDTRSLFQHDLAVAGDNSAARLQLGILESREGNTTAAIADYEDAIHLDPGNYIPEFDLGNLLLQSKPQEAIEHFRNAATDNPNSARVQNNWGVALLDLGQSSAAYNHFQTAIAIDRNFPDAHANQARLLLQSGFPDLARREYVTALQLDPDSVEAKRGLAALSTTQP